MGAHCLRLFLLLLLLRLLDAATGPGLPVSRPEDLASPVAPQSPSWGAPSPSAGPTQGHPPPGTGDSSVPATLPSGWAGQSGRPAEGKAPAEQEGRTPPTAWVNAETQGDPSRTGGAPPTASPPSMPASPTTLLPPTWASSPTSALLKGRPGQASGPTEGGGGGGSASQEPPPLTPRPPGSRGAPAGQSTWTGAGSSPPTPTAEPWASPPSVGTEGAQKKAAEPPGTTPSSQVPSEGPGWATASEGLAGDSGPPETRALVSPGTFLAKPHRELGQAGEGRDEAALAEVGPLGGPTPSKGSPPWPEREPPWGGPLAVAPSSSSPPPSPQGSLARPPPWVSSSPHPTGDGHPMATPSVGPQWPTGGDQAPLWAPTGLPDAAHPLWGAPGKEGVQTPLPTTAPRPPTMQAVWGGRTNRGPPGTTEDAPQQGPGGTGSEPPSRGSPGMEGGQLSARGVFPSSRPPEVQPQSRACSGLTSETTAGSTSETGGTRADPDQPVWTIHPWGVRPRSPTAGRLKDAVQLWPGWIPTPDSLAGPLDNAGSPPGPMELLDPTTTATAGPAEEPPRAATSPAVPREGKARPHPVVLVAQNQPPLLKAAFLPVPCQLVLDMAFSRSFRDPRSPECRSFVRSLNETVSPLLASLPGFQRLEVRNIRPDSVVVEFDALFRPQAPGFWGALNRSALSERLPPGLRVGNASVLRSATRERHLDLCALLFSCQAGYECIMEEEEEAVAGRPACVSLCHRGFCKNHGICTHLANRAPACQCPVGSDFWFLGAHCDYRVTQQAVLGVACGLALSLVALGVAVAGLVARRVRWLLMEARADQTKSSYRRFCRLDDVSAHYWSEPWLASSCPSLDNPAFSRSEELLHLQRTETPCEGGGQGPQGGCRWAMGTPGGVSAAGRTSPPGQAWAESWSSLNDPMVDSGKASEASVSSWPAEPPFFRWSPFPALQKLPREPVSKTPRPNFGSEGMELVNLERSWTA